MEKCIVVTERTATSVAATARVTTMETSSKATETAAPEVVAASETTAVALEAPSAATCIVTAAEPAAMGVAAPALKPTGDSVVGAASDPVPLSQQETPSTEPAPTEDGLVTEQEGDGEQNTASPLQTSQAISPVLGYQARQEVRALAEAANQGSAASIQGLLAGRNARKAVAAGQTTAAVGSASAVQGLIAGAQARKAVVALHAEGSPAEPDPQAAKEPCEILEDGESPDKVAGELTPRTHAANDVVAFVEAVEAGEEAACLPFLLSPPHCAWLYICRHLTERFFDRLPGCPRLRAARNLRQHSGPKTARMNSPCLGPSRCLPWTPRHRRKPRCIESELRHGRA